MVETSTDPGLQAERTALAWRRTQLSLLAIACLALRANYPSVTFLALVASALLWLGLARSYRHSLLMLREERGQARPWRVLATGLTLLAIALAALLATLQNVIAP